MSIKKKISFFSTMHLVVLFIVSLCSPLALQAEPVFTAIYKGNLAGFNIKTERTLRQLSTNTYEFSSISKNTFGTIKESSTFDISDQGLFIPKNYVYNRRVLGSRSEQSIQFNWDILEAHFQRKDKPHKNTQHKIVRGTLDPLLYQLKLQIDAYKKAEKDTEFSYTFVKAGAIKTMNFKMESSSFFDLRNQQYASINIQRINHKDKKHTEIILIPEKKYQIAEIIHTEKDGKTYAMTLTDFSFNTEKMDNFYHKKPH